MTTKTDLPEPTIKVKLKHSGPDGYVALYDPWWSTGTPGREIRVERDGNEWVRTDLSKPIWYRTLNNFRRAVAETNVARWVNSGRSMNASPAHKRWVNAFLKWARQQPGVTACHGTRTYTIPGLGTGEVHDHCCDTSIGRTLPEGVTVLDLYREWAFGEKR